MRVILDAPVGGLGDGLLYSTLPELFAMNTGEKVYLSPRTKTRNPEVFDLLYARNPFIAPERFAEPREGDKIIGSTIAGAHFIRRSRRDTDPIGLIEELHGFARTHDRPKVYYAPTLLPNWINRIFVDPCSFSQAIPAQVFDRFFKRMLFDQDGCEIIVAESPNQGPHGKDSLQGYPRYEVRSIYEYMDIIYSCKYFVVSESGGQCLSAALRRKGIFTVFTTMALNSRFFVFPDVVYNTTGKLSDDYLHNDIHGEGLFV